MRLLEILEIGTVLHLVAFFVAMKTDELATTSWGWR
jgi:hypothetical protein